MRAESSPGQDWVDGFLFLGNRPILDLLNTRPVLEGTPTELLPDVRALERWLIASRMVTAPGAKAALRAWRHSPQAEDFLRQLLAFREKLRASVLRMEAGSGPADDFLAEVNALLLQHPLPAQLHRRQATIVREAVQVLRRPSDLWAQLAAATADLLTERDTSRLRKCESCEVHFFDVSKKGSRRWCSMSICGNKRKVAAYRNRKRSPDRQRK
jgi:predicted RNA-binding Zn ribbon-like protein